MRCSAVFKELRSPLLVQAGLSSKRACNAAMVSWRGLSSVSMGAQFSLGFVGMVATSLSTVCVRILTACEVLIVVSLPVVSMDCLTVGFWR